MQGYYRNPAATAEIYRNGWWETGDLAYMAEDEVLYCWPQKRCHYQSRT